MTDLAVSGEPDLVVAELRAEILLLRDLLAAQDRENNLLRRLLNDRANDNMVAKSAHASSTLPSSARSRLGLHVGSRERMAMLEHTVDVLDCFAAELASQDCYDYGCCDSTGRCAPCLAKLARDEVSAFRFGGDVDVPSRRFEGAMHTRTHDGWHPREAKHHRAWTKYLERASRADHTLALILTDRSHDSGMYPSILDWPMARDWYVATSVVQWLATPVGSCILEAAGWKYTQDDADRALVDAKREAARKKREAAP